MIRSKKLTQSARDEQCTLLTEHCNGDPGKVVFCHAPSNLGGYGLKSPDFWGAYGCSGCHDYIDGRMKDKPSKEESRVIWWRAIPKTINRMFQKGVLKIG